MTSNIQKTRAIQLRELHYGPPILVLPNAWDTASARIFEQAGWPEDQPGHAGRSHAAHHACG